MSAHIDGQPDQGHGGQAEGAARRAEPGQGGGAQGDGDGRVPGQVSEPGGFPAATAAPGQQRHWPGRRTTRLTSFAAAQALVPPRRSRAASSPSPARQAVAALAGTAPKAPSCMTTQAGGYSASGRPLTARKALASAAPTRSRCTAPAVASSAARPRPSRARGSASASRSSTGPTIVAAVGRADGQQRVSRRKSVPVSRIPRMSRGLQRAIVGTMLAVAEEIRGC